MTLDGRSFSSFDELLGVLFEAHARCTNDSFDDFVRIEMADGCPVTSWTIKERVDNISQPPRRYLAVIISDKED